MQIQTLDSKKNTNNFLSFEKFNIKYPEINTDDTSLFYIYKITDKTNGKIYIGKSKNIRRRASEYVSSSKSYKKRRNITDVINEKGIDNFIMEPIVSTTDELDLAKLELEYIINTDCMNPDIGYNRDIQSVITPSKLNNYKPRPQYSNEKMRRSKILCAINPDTKQIVFSTGLKLFGDRIFRSKDEVKSAAKRSSSLNGFYLFYMNKSDFETQVSFAKEKICSGNTNPTYKNFIELSEYIISYIKDNKNDLDFNVNFIHQSDNESGYEYGNINDFIEFFNSNLRWF